MERVDDLLIAEGEDFPAHFSNRCMKFPQFLSAVNEELAALYCRRQYKARLMESRSAVCRQYGELATVLGAAAAELSAELSPDPVRERRLRQHFTYVQQRMKVFLTLYDQGFYGRIHRKFGEVAPAFLPVGRKDQVEWEYRSQFLIEGLEALERVWVERNFQESLDQVVEMARKLTETLV